MFKGNWGRVILTVSLVATFGVSIAVDWNETHLFNPAWTPHAKFHDLAMLHLLTGACVLALWLLWRKSKEPDVAAKVALLVPLIFWLGFFYLTLIFPAASLKASTDEDLPKLLGIELYPNAVVAAISSLLSIAGYVVYRREHPPTSDDEPATEKQ